MKSKYEQLRHIHDLAVTNHDASMLKEILKMLNSWDIKCRVDDGQLLWTNLSQPTSVEETITIGLRYMKKDKSLTEDVFEVSSSNPEKVVSFYKGKYERIRLEYKGTHKRQDVRASSFTSVNSCSLYLGSENDS